jgi:hypothetical protein
MIVLHAAILMHRKNISFSEKYFVIFTESSVSTTSIRYGITTLANSYVPAAGLTYLAEYL